jgi:hypothetical protein
MSFAHHARHAAGLSTIIMLASVALAQDPEALPVCNNNGPYVAECTGQLTCVPVTSAGSFDPDGTPITTFWFEECDFGFFDDPTSPAPNMCLDMQLECVKTCVFALRIFSGGQLVHCNSTVTVQDTTGPVITCPPDVIEIWAGGPAVGQTDPAHTGTATAVDCDPNPVISFSDTSVGNTMAGQPELVVTRTWVATDNCLNQSSCVQIITLLSPSQPLGGLLDLVPNACPNSLGTQMNEGLIPLVLYGTQTFDVTNVDRPTLQLRRADNQGTSIPVGITKLLDRGRPGGAKTPNCGSAVKDGRLDLQVVYSYALVRSALLLDGEKPGSTIEVALTGRLLDGRYFTLRDTVIVAP